MCGLVFDQIQLIVGTSGRAFAWHPPWLRGTPPGDEHEEHRRQDTEQQGVS